MSARDAALWYAEHMRWPIVPIFEPGRRGGCSCELGTQCPSPAKHPKNKGGLTNASTDLDQIRAWWARWPDANLAVRTGKEAGGFVIDIDPRNGGDETLERMELHWGVRTHTVEALTGGGGTHIWFRHPGWYVKTGSLDAHSGKKPWPGIDVKGDGGYVLLPPSVHATGTLYEWEASSAPEDTEIAWADQWILDIVKRHSQNRPRSAAPKVEGPIGEGVRDQTLTSYAGSMRRRGMSEGAILAALEYENTHRCSPPLTPQEVRRIARSVARYEPAETPWHLRKVAT